MVYEIFPEYNWVYIFQTPQQIPNQPGALFTTFQGLIASLKARWPGFDEHILLRKKQTKQWQKSKYTTWNPKQPVYFMDVWWIRTFFYVKIWNHHLIDKIILYHLERIDG